MKKRSSAFSQIGLLAMILFSLTVTILLCGASLRKERQAARLSRAVLLCASAAEAFHGGEDLSAQQTLLRGLADFPEQRETALPCTLVSELSDGIRLELQLSEESRFFTACIRALDEDGTELYRLDCIRNRQGGK